MKASSSPFSKLIKMCFALVAFISSLLLVLYIGFGIQFNRPPIKAQQTAKNTVPNQPVTFYKSVGATAPTAITSPKGQGSPVTDKYTIELNVVNVRSEAEKIVNDLAQKGVRAYFTPFQSHGKVFYRIRQGLFSSKSVAENEARRFRTAQNLPANVIKLR